MDNGNQLRQALREDEQGLGIVGSDRYKCRINACLVNLFILVVLVLWG